MTCISKCLADSSAWTAEHHLKLSLSKTELLVIPGKDCPHMDLLVTVEDVTVSYSSTVRNTAIILSDGLSCAPNITAVARSCRFALYKIHMIWSFLAKDTAQLLVQALVISHLDYCNSLLAGLPASETKQLQSIQNAAAHLIYNPPKFCPRDTPSS